MQNKYETELIKLNSKTRIFLLKFHNKYKYKYTSVKYSELKNWKELNWIGKNLINPHMMVACTFNGTSGLHHERESDSTETSLYPLFHVIRMPW